MPTYLTPGVYVEEVPSTSKPIEGVGTSIAAFVGLAPGGPVNTPMRISNWTQFAKIFGDPNEPDNGPFMDGAYLAHSVYGFFQNGGDLCWVVRVGAGGDGAAGRAAGGAAGGGRQARVEAFRAEALEGVDGTVAVEIVEVAAPLPERGRRGRRRRRRDRPTSSSSTPAPRGSEEFEGLTLKKGRQNLATKVNAAVQAHQARGDRRVAAGRPPGRRHVHAVGAEPRPATTSSRPTSRATSPAARAWAGWPRSTR